MRRQPTQESGEDPAAKSTEAQELHENLRQYREFRASSRGSQSAAESPYEGFRSSSPTGTGASDFAMPGEDIDAPPGGSTPDAEGAEQGEEVNSSSDDDDDGDEENRGNVDMNSIIELHVPAAAVPNPEPEAAITRHFPNGIGRPQDGYVGADAAAGPGGSGTGEKVAPPVAAQPIRDEYVSQQSATKPDTL